LRGRERNAATGFWATLGRRKMGTNMLGRATALVVVPLVVMVGTSACFSYSEESCWEKHNCDLREDDLEEDDFEEEDAALDSVEAEEPVRPPEGECETGQSAPYSFAWIGDDPDSETLKPCSTAGNPGADIDAVCLRAPDDTLKACAASVEYDDTNSAGCQNDQADPTQVPGPPDGVAADGVCEGYFSLNGGAIVVSLDNNEEILCGDIIQVVEMYNPAIPTSTIEDYKVWIGFSADGPWDSEFEWATGETDFEVSWTW